jgi:DNA-binding IclR family transcriptional regulator
MREHSDKPISQISYAFLGDTRACTSCVRCSANVCSMPTTGSSEIEQVRQQGYSIDRGDYIGGVVIVAVPVLGVHALTHGIAAVGLAGQIDQATAIRLANDMQVSARALAG